VAKALSPTMTVRDFENGYWYLDQLKNFAERIGIPAAKKLRKDELEQAIVAFLRGTQSLTRNRCRDVPCARCSYRCRGARIHSHARGCMRSGR